jgi:WD40 repeat protein/serine/threonine protein kinase
VNDADRQILFGLVAIRLKLVTLSQVTRALSDWSTNGEVSLARLLIERRQLDLASGALVESAVEHHVTMAGGDAASSLESFSGSDDLEALRHVLERTIKPGPAMEKTVARGEGPAVAAQKSGNGRSKPREVTHIDLESDERSHGTLIYDGVSGSGATFEVLRPLARGGLGEVFVARDGRLNREVALKLIEESQAADSQSRARFLLEAEITGGLEHPGIVPVYALGENSDGRLFYAMRLVRGETLKERIRKFHNAGSIGRQPVAFRQMLNHFVRICDIVAYAHSRGVLHRDLKPSNVMLGKFGETLVVDWGLAKSIEPSAESPATVHDEVKLRPISGSSVKGTMHGVTLGTPQYMSPEQALGQLDRVARVSDVYSLGATLYCILTGAPPLAEINDVGAVLSRVALGDIAAPQSLKSDVPPTLNAICCKAMAVRQEDRYQSVRALETDIESWLADEPVQGVAEPLARRLTTWERKHRTFLRGSAMALVAVALVSVLAAIFVNTARQRAEEGRQRADEQSRIAETRKQEADRQSDALRRFSTRLTLDRGLSLLESNSRRAGVLWLARSLESAEGQRDPLEPAIRGNLAAWSPLVHRLKDCLEHQSAVRVVAWSPTGRAIATGSDDGIVRIWDPTSSSIGSSSITVKHAGGVRTLAFTRDGKTLATGSLDQTARLWTSASGLPRGEPMRHRGPVVSVAFSPDDSRLVTGSEDGMVRFWDAATGDPRGKPFEHGKPLKSVVLALDGKSLASLDEAGGAIIWNTQTGEPRFKRQEHPGEIEVVAFSPDSTKLVCGGQEDQLFLLSTADGGEISHSSKGVPGERVQAIAFSHDGTKIAIGNYDTTCSIARVPDLAPLGPKMEHRGHVWAVAFSPDDSLLAAAADDNTAQLWNAQTFERAGDALPHQKPVRAVAFSPDGRMLISGCEDGIARVWQLGGDSGIGQPMQHGEPVRTIAARPDGKAIATVTAGGGVWLWDASTTRSIAHAKGHDAGTRFELFFNPAGTVLYSAGEDATLRLWNGATLEPIGPAIKMTAWIRSLAISPDGSSIAAGDQHGRIGFWDARTGKPLAPVAVQQQSVTAIAYNPDGTRLAMGDAAGDVQIWDAARFRRIGDPMHHQGAIRDVAFSPDGTRLASASYDKTARLWDALSGAPICPPLAHRAYVWRVRFDHAGARLVTASFDGTAQIWNAGTGKPMGEPLDHGELVYDAVWSDDSTRVLTYGRSRSARLWDGASSRVLGEPMSHGVRVDGALFLPGKSVIATCSRDGTARLWTMPALSSTPAEQVALEASVMTGMELGADDLVKSLDVRAWRSRRDELEMSRNRERR